MDINIVMNSAAGMIAFFGEVGQNRTLQEFEQLAYEQACRTMEMVMRQVRENLEEHEENEELRRRPE